MYFQLVRNNGVFTNRKSLPHLGKRDRSRQVQAVADALIRNWSLECSEVTGRRSRQTEEGREEKGCGLGKFGRSHSDHAWLTTAAEYTPGLADDDDTADVDLVRATGMCPTMGMGERRPSSSDAVACARGCTLLSCTRSSSQFHIENVDPSCAMRRISIDSTWTFLVSISGDVVLAWGPIEGVELQRQQVGSGMRYRQSIRHGEAYSMLSALAGRTESLADAADGCWLGV